MGVMKNISIELQNASNLIKWMESRITELEQALKVLKNEQDDTG